MTETGREELPQGLKPDFAGLMSELKLRPPEMHPCEMSPEKH